MSIDTVMARMAELHATFGTQPRTVARVAEPAAAQNATQFSSLLNQAGGPMATQAVAPTAGGTVGDKIVALAQAEVGQAEAPPGSNDSPRISEYRSATAGSPGPGPWCAYFTSWAAKSAGVPLGDHGQGFGSVDAVYSWAQSSGKANPISSGTPPKPGDLIVWDEHIGVVKSVGADGTINTIEGNSSDKVSERTYGKDGGGAIGFVSLS
jgi:hypothetical protein